MGVRGEELIDFLHFILYIYCQMGPSQHTPRILFVDDDAELRQLVSKQLAEAGYAVEESGDGRDAIRKLQNAVFDVILLDIMLPGISGIDVLKFMRDHDLPCRIIMITGLTGLSFAVRSITLGADDYITKPYTLEYLMSSIRRVLGK